MEQRQYQQKQKYKPNINEKSSKHWNDTGGITTGVMWNTNDLWITESTVKQTCRAIHMIDFTKWKTCDMKQF